MSSRTDADRLAPDTEQMHGVLREALWIGR